MSFVYLTYDVAQAETEAAKDEKPKSPSLFAKLLAPFKGDKKEKKPKEKKEKAKKEEAKVRFFQSFALHLSNNISRPRSPPSRLPPRPLPPLRLSLPPRPPLHPPRKSPPRRRE